MIVPMKKVAVVTQAKDSDAAIDRLAGLGLLHVEHQQPPQGDAIVLLQEEIRQIEQAQAILSELKIPLPQHDMPGQPDIKQVVLQVHALWKRKEELAESCRGLVAKITQWQEWGDFQPELIRQLRDKQIILGLYQIPLKHIAQLPEGLTVTVLSSRAGMANCLFVSRTAIDFGVKELALPEFGLSQMRLQLHAAEQERAQVMQGLAGYLHQQSQLAEARCLLQQKLEFQEALAGMGSSGQLSFITGYIPFDCVEALAAAATRAQWALLVTTPQEEDNVPVLLRNPRWIALINPVFKFLEILPGYRELDISVPFLIFFSIFFGILIGDAGYGALYLLVTFLFHQKARRQSRPTGSFCLFYVLSSAAIIWGILTGTFFGQEWVLKAGYRPLAPALVDDQGMQRFCFFLGALHLSIAHIWRALLKAPSLAALADLGWTAILWAAFFIARMLILGDPFPFFGPWLIAGGVACVILFTSPQRNLLKAIGAGLGTLALSLMNSFTDVVSYIRLFAVGMAGVAIADAFNAMAAMVGRGTIVAFIAAALIALVGHALGALLGPVSVLVHGVRLNVLEFSGHAGISWSGAGYRPLKKSIRRATA